MTAFLFSSILRIISRVREVARYHAKANKLRLLRKGTHMINKLLHTPEGVRDTYGKELIEKKNVMSTIKKQFSSYGYSDIETPMFEFFDVFSKEVGTIPSRELYKFFDKEGNTLVLRPDFTPSMARCAAKYYSHESLPVRFAYSGSTFINKSELQGKLKENTDLGVEYIGDASVEADVEMISLLIDSLKSIGLDNFQISIGQVDYFKGLCEEAGLDFETEELLREYISNKNLFGAEELLNEKNISNDIKKMLTSISDIFGSIDAIKKSQKLLNNNRSLAATKNLEQINDILVSLDKAQYVSYDLGMLSKYNYYTGIIFEAFTYGVGDPIAKGGRYDLLLKQFGKDAPATGFVIPVGTVINALNRQQISISTNERNVLLLHEASSYLEALEIAQELRGNSYSVAVTAKNYIEDSLSDLSKIDEMAQSRQIKEILFVSEIGLQRYDFDKKELINCTIDDIIGV